MEEIRPEEIGPTEVLDDWIFAPEIQGDFTTKRISSITGFLYVQHLWRNALLGKRMGKGLSVLHIFVPSDSRDTVAAYTIGMNNAL